METVKNTLDQLETLAPATSVSQSLPISGLRASLKGRVITPEDADYDAVRTGLSREAVRRPALIVRPVDARDVSRVVTLAREMGMELAIRSGGHSLTGFSTSEGGIVLDLSQMKDLKINVEERTAWAEAGLTAGEYTAETAKFDLATGFGDTASVGLGGLATGGGIGYLVRKYGLTIDNLLAAIVVTADGQIRHVNAETHPGLFWAIRGGGGNFGVVTHFKFRLHEVSTVVGGMLILPATAKVMAAFAAAAEAAPEELSTIVYNMPAPPMPFLPEEYHGQVVTLAMLVYTGDVEEGLRVVAPFRELAEPIVDMIGPMPYPEIYWPDDPNFHPVTALRSKFIDRIDERTAQIMLDHLHASTADVRIAEFRVLGGAMAHVPFTFASAADSLADIILKEASGRALVTGLSLGGYVAMELARRSPDLVAGLVLSGCSFNFDGLLGHYLKFASWLMQRGWLKLSTEQSKVRVKRMFPPALSDVAEAQLRAGVFPDALGPSYAEMAGKDFSAVMRQFPGPVLILNGERDASSRRGESKFISVARQGRGQNIPDAGHACNLDQPEKYILAVREFAKSIGWVASQVS